MFGIWDWLQTRWSAGLWHNDYATLIFCIIQISTTFLGFTEFQMIAPIEQQPEKMYIKMIFYVVITWYISQTYDMGPIVSKLYQGYPITRCLSGGH